MDAMKGLSSDTIEKIILEIEDNTFLWDKAQKNYKDQALEEVTWSRISGNTITELHIEQTVMSTQRECSSWISLEDSV